MNQNVTLIFRGFSVLLNLEKLKLIESVNGYFDWNDREPIRSKNETEFVGSNLTAPEFVCQCCGKLRANLYNIFTNSC